jgi:hypothetical protein
VNVYAVPPWAAEGSYYGIADLPEGDSRRSRLRSRRKSFTLAPPALGWRRFPRVVNASRSPTSPDPVITSIKRLWSGDTVELTLKTLHWSRWPR